VAHAVLQQLRTSSDKRRNDDSITKQTLQQTPQDGDQEIPGDERMKKEPSGTAGRRQTAA